MPDYIVGLMFNKNEGDILQEIIEAALPHVNSIMIADDGSMDKSWDIIQSIQNKHKDKVEHIQRNPNTVDKGQKQSLLDKIQQRYRPENTLVQIIESDIMIVDTDIRKAFKERSNGVYLNWILLNAAREGKRGWEGADDYPY